MVSRLLLALLLGAVLSSSAEAQTSATVDFDNPRPPGASGDLLNGVFQGIDFGSSQWRWESAYGAASSNHIYFSSGTGTSRTVTFSPAPRRLDSLRAFSPSSGTLTLRDNLGQTKTQSISSGSLQLVTTGWTQGSTTVTVDFTSGWDLSVDDVVSSTVSTPATISSLAPSPALVGAAYTQTVNGTNFVSGSVVNWNGTARPTTFVSATRLTAAISAGDVASTGTATLTVVNPAPDGGTSNPVSLPIVNPAPTISALSPSGATAGGPAFVLTVGGSGFVSGSAVSVAGNLRTTTVVSSSQLTASIPASDIAVAGSRSVTVTNPAPGGGTSSALSFVVSTGSGGSGGYALRFHGNGVNAPDADRVKIRIDNPPGPPADVGATDFTLEFWMKAAAAENGAAAVTCGPNINWIYGNIVFDRDRFNRDRKFGLSIAGGRFVFGVSGDGTGDRTICGVTSVLDNGWHHVAVQRRRADGWMWLYVDGRLEAQAAGPGGDVSYPDNSAPGNFCNGPCTNDPFLVIGAEKHDAGAQYPSYSGFIDEVRLSEILRYPTNGNFAPPTQPFTPDADTAALYHFDEGQGDLIADSSGAPGGPSTGVRNFGGSPAGPEWVTDTPFSALGGNPIPSTTSISPSSAPVGGAGFTLTVNGSGFVSGSMVRWNGSGRATAFVSPTQLTAAVSAADIATVGTAAVTVVTPAPGGGTSNSQTFTISGGGTTTVTFDNPVPPGASGSFLNGVFQGIDFGTNQWAWESALDPDPTRHIYFGSSSGTSRSFTFSPGPRTFVSLRVFTPTAGTLTLTDNVGQTWTQSITTGSMQTVTTGWTSASTTVTVTFTAGWNLAIDDIVYR
jgi:concanavalin A-like lectin/glucanase superfamily protein